MRIALFSDTFYPQVNGVVTVTHLLAQGLTALGHEVRVFVLSSASSDALSTRQGISYPVERIGSAPIPFYPGERMTLPVGLTRQRLREFKPHIIHTHTPFTLGWEAVRAAAALGVPLVGTHHTFYDHYMKIWRLDYPWARRGSWRVTNAYYNHCAQVVTPTHALARAMQHSGLTVPVRVIKNPVALTDFTARPTPHAASEQTVVYMGRLSVEKDVDLVVRAFALAQKSVPAARLTIVGDGPARASLEALADSLGITAATTFTGFMNHEGIANVFHQSSVFATGSRSENMPVSVLEAMATKLPVVAVDALGLPEMVEEGASGYIVPPDDASAMADRLVALLRDALLREKFGERSRTLALGQSEEIIAALHVKLYEEVAGRSTSSA